MKEKKQWQKPALIVLVRRKPEEAVMEVCKVFLEAIPGVACYNLLCADSGAT